MRKKIKKVLNPKKKIYKSFSTAARSSRPRRSGRRGVWGGGSIIEKMECSQIVTGFKMIRSSSHETIIYRVKFGTKVLTLLKNVVIDIFCSFKFYFFCKYFLFYFWTYHRKHSGEYICVSPVEINRRCRCGSENSSNTSNKRVSNVRKLSTRNFNGRLFPTRADQIYKRPKSLQYVWFEFPSKIHYFCEIKSFVQNQIFCQNSFFVQNQMFWPQ